MPRRYWNARATQYLMVDEWSVGGINLSSRDQA